MKKTYVTTMPDHIGAFLRASRCFAALDINITRVSYNKAVDSQTLFIDAEGTEAQLARADEELTTIGYLRTTPTEQSVILLEFKLPDRPGSVTDILALIDEFHFNISYISSQENGSDYQLFKMGLFVDDPAKITEFLSRAEAICPLRMIEYNRADKVFDNSIFYTSFVSTLAAQMDISAADREALLVNTNLAMQTLDETGLSPYRT
ncbi:MAG: Zn-dependent hydrolase, partial [Clostridia bacterium]|nr:Zn-dependent hydrolase [Clostridia bacterium]